MAEPNDSTTGGILTPAAAPALIEDDALDAAFQALVSGITGIDGTLVRPRWQPTPPKQPEPGTDWCAIGVANEDPDDSPYIEQSGDAPGSDKYIEHETIELLASFYGPNAGANAKLLRHGLRIPQNLESLAPYGIKFQRSGPVRTAPDLINQQWVHRKDVPLTFRREATRIYQVRTLVAGSVHLFDDTGHVDDEIDVDTTSNGSSS